MSSEQRSNLERTLHDAAGRDLRTRIGRGDGAGDGSDVFDCINWGYVCQKQTDETGNYIWRRFLKYTSVAHGGMRYRYYVHQRGVMYVSCKGWLGPLEIVKYSRVHDWKLMWTVHRELRPDAVVMSHLIRNMSTSNNQSAISSLILPMAMRKDRPIIWKKGNERLISQRNILLPRHFRDSNVTK
jgi:hypothetical protein